MASSPNMVQKDAPPPSQEVLLRALCWLKSQPTPVTPAQPEAKEAR
ncbi:MAG TPA: hypothetical protein VD902_13795 [Symbiobacteriaceae bacterium]|nr:hypothetical protein [Symbiobacteriaceae bacterium]